MKRFPFTLLAFCVLSCSGRQNDNKIIPGSTAATPGSANAPADNAAETPAQQPKQSPYELHGVIDPGINNMVAFALQIPRGWKMQQSFTRLWNRSTPINQIYVKLVSPGSDNIVEFLPSASYFYTDGPMARNMRQMAASYGTAMPRTQGEMMPMSPAEYLRRILLPQLAQRGLHVNITGQKTLASISSRIPAPRAPRWMAWRAME